MAVRTAQGELGGTVENGIAVFRGVPYAAPPVGPLRFAPPQPMAPWPDVRDATRDGPIAPQGKSRLGHVMGDFERPQSEDCLTLTLWSPAPDAGRRPVIFWIHGGAFVTGAGSLPCYSGERFAANENVVVVAPNYRLGALGFLAVPGLGGGNYALQDLALALRWVQENIRAFGGDPANVTLVGQSAGGSAIAGLMAMPAAKGLFHRAVVQSAPLGRVARPAQEAKRLGRRFLEILGTDVAGIRDVPAAKLVAAQGELARLEKRFADTAGPFGLTIDGSVLPGDVVAALEGGAGSEVDLMIGTTREEMSAFYSLDEQVLKADEPKIRAEFVRLMGARGGEYYDEYRRWRTDFRPAAAMADLNTDRVFRMPSLSVAEARAALGRPAYVYQFDWQSPKGHQACHCIELPFVFNNFPDWDAPMIEGGDPVSMAGLANAMQKAWAAFARTGDPNHAGLPPWRPYEASRMTMRFDSVIEPISDLAGRAWRLPWG